MWPWTKKSQMRKTVERRITRLALESLEMREVLSAGPLSTAGMIKPIAGPPPLVAQPTLPAAQDRLTINESRQNKNGSNSGPTQRPLCMRP
jgi:hypothetical protein